MLHLAAVVVSKSLQSHCGCTFARTGGLDCTEALEIDHDHMLHFEPAIFLSGSSYRLAPWPCPAMGDRSLD